MALTSFFDFTANDLIGVYSDIEKAKAERDAAKYLAQGSVQQQTLHAPQYETAHDSITGGNAVVPGADKASYWDEIPKPLLYGSLGLLGLGVLLLAVK